MKKKEVAVLEDGNRKSEAERYNSKKRNELEKAKKRRRKRKL